MSTLNPDRSRSDFVTFYDRIGAEQLEERYMAGWAYAIARYKLTLSLLEPHARRGERLLDVGCASGYYSVAYAEHGGTVLGVDISAASVALARRRAESHGVAERCEFKQGDMRRLGDVPGENDVALMTEVIEHVREQQDVFREVLGLLRPGGKLYVATPHALDELSWFGRLRHLNAPTPEHAGVTVERLGTNTSVEEAGIAHEPYFHDAFTYRQLADLIPTNLGRVVEQRSLYFVPPVLALIPTVNRLLRRQGDTHTRAGGESGAPADDDVVEISEPGFSASLIIAATRTGSRIPLIRKIGRHNLMIVERA